MDKPTRIRVQTAIDTLIDAWATEFTDTDFLEALEEMEGEPRRLMLRVLRN